MISPYGVNEIEKIRYFELPTFLEYTCVKNISDDLHTRKIAARYNEVFPANIGNTALTLVQRLENAGSKMAAAEAMAAERESEAAKDDPMATEIGRRVLRYFPDLSIIQPGSAEENALRYKPLEAVLHALSGEHEVLDMLREKSRFDQLLEAALATQSSQHVSGR